MMNRNFKNLIRIMVPFITVTMMIMGCTATDKKCMPLTSTSKKARALAWEAQALNADGFTIKAVEMFKQALELDSNFVAANLWYGQNAGLGNIEKHKYFTRAERNMGNVPEAEQHMIKTYLALEKNDRETVINEIKAIIALYPEDKYMLRLLAVRYYGFGQYENALEYIRKSCEADTTFSTAVYYQGYVLYAMGKIDEAEKMYKKSIEMNPGVPLYYNNYGQLLRSSGRIDEAMKMHNKAIEIEPSFLAYLYLGHCYSIKGDYSLARENYSKAFDISTSNAQKNTVSWSMASTYLFESNLAEACAILDKHADFNRKLGNMDIEVINSIVNKGFCYLHYNDLSNAEKYINEATGLIPTLNLTETERKNYEKYAIFWKGWFQAVSGKPVDAQKSLDEFKSSMKDEAELDAMKFYWNSFQGIVAFSKKKWSDAASLLNSPNVGIIYYYDGLAYQNAGDKEKAKEVFSKIVNNNLIGLQQALVKPFAIIRLSELAK
jgi:tetratricopeptide (TPR) repeat protein